MLGISTNFTCGEIFESIYYWLYVPSGISARFTQKPNRHKDSIMADATRQNTEEAIEDNMLVSWFETRFGFLKPHYTTIAIVAGLLILGIILFMFLQKMRNDNYAIQWQGFNTALSNTLTDSARGIGGGASHLTELHEQFPDSVSSEWALLIAGNMTLNEGLNLLGTKRESAMKKLKKAKSQFQTIVDSKNKKKPMLEHRSVLSLAYTLESLGEFDEAAKYYSQLVDATGEDSEFADFAKRGLNRSNDEGLRDFYVTFKNRKMGTAPGVTLPTRPSLPYDIFTLPEGEEAVSPEFLNGSNDTPKTMEPTPETPKETTPTETEVPKVEEPKNEEPKTETEPKAEMGGGDVQPSKPEEARKTTEVENVEVAPAEAEVVPGTTIEEVVPDAATEIVPGPEVEIAPGIETAPQLELEEIAPGTETAPQLELEPEAPSADNQ